MKVLIIIVAIFAAVYVGMLIATYDATPYDPSWDYWDKDE